MDGCVVCTDVDGYPLDGWCEFCPPASTQAFITNRDPGDETDHDSSVDPEE